jgi:hypothetical protein
MRDYRTLRQRVLWDGRARMRCSRGKNGQGSDAGSVPRRHCRPCAGRAMIERQRRGSKISSLAWRGPLLRPRRGGRSGPRYVLVKGGGLWRSISARLGRAQSWREQNRHKLLRRAKHAFAHARMGPARGHPLVGSRGPTSAGDHGGPALASSLVPPYVLSRSERRRCGAPGARARRFYTLSGSAASTDAGVSTVAPARYRQSNAARSRRTIGFDK